VENRLKIFKKIGLILALLLSLHSVFAQKYCKDDFPAFYKDASDELKTLFDTSPQRAYFLDAWGYMKKARFDETYFSDAEWIKKLGKDIANEKYKLIDIFDDDINDVFKWKQLKENPFEVVELMKETTDPNWLKWVEREYWKAVLEKGNKFNKHMTANNHAKLKEAFRSIIPNFDDVVIVDELQVLPVKKVDANGVKTYGSKVIFDNGFVQKVTNNFGDFEYYRVIYNDNKFGLKSPWTTNQKTEIIHQFRDNPNLEYITLEVRTVDDKIPDNKINFRYKTEIRLYREDVYKSISNGVNDNPEFSRIISMNQINFKN